MKSCLVVFLSIIAASVAPAHGAGMIGGSCTAYVTTCAGLDQASSPTWSGSHKFLNPVMMQGVGSSTYSLTLSSGLAVGGTLAAAPSGVLWADGTVSTTAAGGGGSPYIHPQDIGIATITSTQLFRMDRSTPTTYAVRPEDIFALGTRETNGRVGLQFFPPCQGGQCGVLKLGLQTSGEGDPFDRDSDGVVIMNPTSNRTTSLGNMGYPYSCMRVTQGDNFGAEYVHVCEDGLRLSTGPNAQNTTVAFDTEQGSGTLSGNLQAYQVVVTSGVRWPDGSFSTTAAGGGGAPYVHPANITLDTVTVTNTFRIQASTPVAYMPLAEDILAVGRESNGRTGLMFFPPANGGGIGGILKLGMQMNGEGDPYNRDSDGIYVLAPSLNRGARINANRFALVESDNAANSFFMVDDTQLYYRKNNPTSYIFYLSSSTGRSAFGTGTPDANARLTIDGIVAQKGPTKTLLDYGAMTQGEIQAAICPATYACRVQNFNDFDIYTSTGTGAGQWRNSRTGLGP